MCTYMYMYLGEVDTSDHVADVYIRRMKPPAGFGLG